MRPDTGGPAFPISREQSYNGISASSGMTLRDYFAAKAMPSIEPRDISNEDVAMFAYELADAMLAERSKRSAT